MDKLKNVWEKILNALNKFSNYVNNEDENNNKIIKYIKKFFQKFLAVIVRFIGYLNETLMLDVEEGRTRRIAVLFATVIMIIFLIYEAFFPKENALAVYIDNEYIASIPKEENLETFEEDLNSKMYEKYGETIEYTDFEVTSEKVIEDVENLITYDSLFEKAYSMMDAGVNYIGYSIFVEGKEELMLKTEDEANLILDKILEAYTTENTIESGFVENVEIKNSTGILTEYTENDVAYEYLTHSVIKEKEHTIVEGDTLWDIAWLNDITVDELLEMNPEITEETILQLDMVLKLVLPKPYLSTYNIEQVTYDDVAYRSVEVIENNEEYKTYNKVITEGSDGERTVTDKIKYVNGIETERETLEEIIHIAPVTKVVEVGTLNAPPKKAIGTFINPTRGTITDVFGSRGGAHAGLDIAAPTGTAVYASDGGKVIRAGWFSTYGNIVIIDHQNGFQTYYAHNSAIHVSVGQMVAQGELIASMGSTGDSTGPHCHFEIRVNGIPKNPMNYLE